MDGVDSGVPSADNDSDSVRDTNRSLKRSSDSDSDPERDLSSDSDTDGVDVGSCDNVRDRDGDKMVAVGSSVGSFVVLLVKPVAVSVGSWVLVCDLERESVGVVDGVDSGVPSTDNDSDRD